MDRITNNLGAAQDEIVQTKTAELSQETREAIAFVLNYQPYACYDAAPRIKAVLLRSGIKDEDCNILTSPSSRHFWVRMGTETFSTTDMPNFRQAPTTNDKTRELEQLAKRHAETESKEEFDNWIYDKNGELLKIHQKTEDDVRRY